MMKSQLSVGTLNYDVKSFIFLIFYLLGGGFFYIMIANILVPTVLPLIMNKFSASPTIIAIVIGSIPATLNMILNPILSTNSDRLRSKFGRRIPFLLFATPFVSIFLIMLGWIEEISTFLHGLSFFASTSVNVLAVVLVCVISILFQFFSLFIGSIYYYLLPDVVPHDYLGRFMAAVNLLMFGSSAIFNYFLMEYIKDYSNYIFTVIGVCFFFTFMLLCLKVKEGTYPDVVPLTDNKSTLWVRGSEWVIGYFRESFSNKFFVILFVGTALNQVSTICRMLFLVLFATDDLHLSEGQYGKIMGIASAASLIVIVAGGYIMDKLHPLRIYISSCILVALANILGYFWVSDYNSFMVIGILTTLVYAIQGVSFVPMLAALFPQERFGQYSSANAMLNSVIMMLMSGVGGMIIKYFGFRFLFIWDFVFTLFAFFAMMYVFVKWKRNHYQSPGVVQSESY